MSWDQRLFLQDVIHARRDTVVATKLEIRKKANTRVTWSYQPTEEVLRKSPGGNLVARQAMLGIKKIPHDVSRSNNTAATALLYPYFSRLQGRFYLVEKERFRIGANVSCLTRMVGMLHNGDDGTLYWVQYRKSGTQPKKHVEITASVEKMTYLDDPEYRGFGLKLLDIGNDEFGKRYLRENDVHQLKLWSSDELNEFFDPVFHAVRELREEGFQPEKPKKRRPRPSEDQPDLFK